MKLIKLSEEHYIVVDDSEIKEGDWYYDTNDKESLMPIYQRSQDPKFYSGCKKITHSTKPIEFGWGQEGRDIVSKKVYNKVKPISLSKVKELFGEVDVEKKIPKYHIGRYHYSYGERPDIYSYRKGYNQALEDNKEKKYTEEDMVEWAMCMIAQYVHGNTNIWNKDLLRESLPQPKTEWEVEFSNGKLKLKK